MKSKVGVVCIVLGVLLLAGAAALGIYNVIQDIAARDAAAAAMFQLVEQLQENAANEPTIPEDAIVPGLELQIPVDLLTDEDKKMAEVKVDGYNYIGYLSIPALELELPIMSSWSYRQLRIAPCRYSGSLRGEDLVLMAHNYSRHFGKISKLNEGDTISFTDVDGVVTHYQVVAMDILEPTAVEVMTSGEFDLTLFTCTYGGGSRVTVCCNKK